MKHITRTNRCAALGVGVLLLAASPQALGQKWAVNADGLSVAICGEALGDDGCNGIGTYVPPDIADCVTGVAPGCPPGCVIVPGPNYEAASGFTGQFLPNHTLTLLDTGPNPIAYDFLSSNLVLPKIDKCPPPPGVVSETSGSTIGFVAVRGRGTRTLEIRWQAISVGRSLGIDIPVTDFFARACTVLNATIDASVIEAPTGSLRMSYELTLETNATSSHDCPTAPNCLPAPRDCPAANNEDPAIVSGGFTMTVEGETPLELVPVFTDQDSNRAVDDKGVIFLPTARRVTIDLSALVEQTMQFPGRGADPVCKKDLEIAWLKGVLKLHLISPTFRPPGGESVKNYFRCVGTAGGPGPGYPFRMGRHEITNAQFSDFLNDAECDNDPDCTPGAPGGGSNMSFGFSPPADPDDGMVYAPGNPGDLMFAPGGLRLPNNLLNSDSRITYDKAFPAGARYSVKPKFEDHPATWLSWLGAVKFCNWLTLDQELSAADQCYAEGDYGGNFRPKTISTANWWGHPNTANNPVPQGGARDLNDAERQDLVLNFRGFRLPMDNLGVQDEWVSNQANPFNEWYQAAAFDPLAPAMERIGPGGETIPPNHWFFGYGRDPIFNEDANFWNESDDPPLDPFNTPFLSIEGTTPVGFYNGTLYNPDPAPPGGPPPIGLLDPPAPFQTVANSNPYDIFDLSGNANEWSQDYGAGGPDGGGAARPAMHVIRSGSWRLDDVNIDPDNFVRQKLAASYRNSRELRGLDVNNFPAGAEPLPAMDPTLGFRVVQSYPDTPPPPPPSPVPTATQAYQMFGNATGAGWSWCINGDSFSTCDLNVDGVRKGSAAAVAVQQFVDSINAVGAPGLSSAAFDTIFTVTATGAEQIQLCVGPFGQLPDCCLPINVTCEINPTSGGLTLTGEKIVLSGDDCNQNGIDDAIDIANGTVDDVDMNDIPDICEGEGACCGAAPGTCSVVLKAQCVVQGGNFLGDGTQCPNPACDVGACCDLASGECTSGEIPSSCSGGSNVFQGFGTDCEPNCCVQPQATGSDTCDMAQISLISVPQVGDPPVTITITGDNSTASGPDCPGLAPDPLWWEAFDIDDCATVTISFCCSDPVFNPIHAVMAADCPCGTLIPGTLSMECDDGNEQVTWDDLAPGTYYYPIYSAADGSLHGQYHMHITATPCSVAACCEGSVCSVANVVDCTAAGGHFLGASIPDCSAQPCDTGACCAASGGCEDSGGAGVSEADCNTIHSGQYIGGALCSTLPDADGDGLRDPCDNCPDDFNDSQDDNDDDGQGDPCDNCVNTPNSDQVDTDGDGVGDACDECPGFDDLADADFDGDPDGCDPCPNDPEDDSDGDGICGDVDNCPSVDNAAHPTPFDCNGDGDTDDPGEGADEQCDQDGDGFGDVCDICPDDPDKAFFDICGCGIPDTDDDNDFVADCDDNCTLFFNPGQEDIDGNGIGDACQDEVVACCGDDGSCDDTTVQDCVTSGRTQQGEGSTCATTTCPAREACCTLLFDGCTNAFPEECVDLWTGIPLGPGTQCLTECPSGFPIPVRKPCCLPDGVCRDIQPPCCEVLGGVSVADCLDLDGDGIDDDCPDQVFCCVPEPGGDCAEVDLGTCVPNGGVIVPACLQDDNGDGINDACDQEICCSPDPGGGCGPVPVGTCVPGGGVVVSMCLGDCNNDGIDDGCDDGQPAQQVRMLIKPGVCPAPINPDSNGIVWVLLTGEAGFDVSTVIQSSLELRRCDGQFGAATPNTGPPGPKISIRDNDHPPDLVTCNSSVPCACNANEGADGIDDLRVPFRVSDMKAAGLLDGVTGDVISLELSGARTDAPPFVATDCIRLLRDDPFVGQPLVVEANTRETYVEASPFDDNLEDAGFTTLRLTYPEGVLVTVTAPVSSEGRSFVRWMIDGVLQDVGVRTVEVVVAEGMIVKAFYRRAARVVPDGQSQPDGPLD